VYLLDKCKYVYILFFFILIMNGEFIKAETMIIDDMRNANGEAEKAIIHKAT